MKKPVWLSTVCEATFVSPLSALSRSLVFALCEDSKAGTAQGVELRFQPRPSVSRWWGHILSLSMFCVGEKRLALARRSSTSFCTSVKPSADLCLSILFVQLSNGMSLTNFSLSLLLKPQWSLERNTFHLPYCKNMNSTLSGVKPWSWEQSHMIGGFKSLGKSRKKHSLRNLDLQFRGRFC